MSRGVVLIAVLLFCCFIAGCLGPADTSTDEVTTSPSPTASPTPTAGPTPAPTTPIEYDFDVPRCPEFPPALTNDSVSEHATHFEQAYASRSFLRDTSANITSIRVSTDNPNATRLEDGWLVHFDVIGPATTANVPGSTETEHSDPPVYGVSYYVTGETVVRLVSLSADDPREEGERVYCPPRR